MPSSGDPAWFRSHRIGMTERVCRSLSWRGDELVDWVGGGDSWTLDGRFTSAHRGWGYERLNAAATDPTGHWALVHERTGTAGLLLHRGEIVREVHRDIYHADAFEFPACLFERQGRLLLAHCPDSYARIEIDDAQSGERLTSSSTRKAVDFFHSRLQASPGGRQLASAGWMWHPWDAIALVDVEAGLADPTTLDAPNGPQLSHQLMSSEQSSAAWLDDDRVLIGGTSEDGEETAGTDNDPASPYSLAVYDLRTRSNATVVPLDQPTGPMMRVGQDHVLTLFGHPRLVSLSARKVVHEWPDIASGELVSSIVRDQPYPILALDPARCRFAVAGEGHIDIVEVDAVKAPERKRTHTF